MRLILALTLLMVFGSAAYSATFHVPGDFSSIQDAIDGVAVGDTVIVSPGTYLENLDFKGKAVTVKGIYGLADQTIIDGGQNDCVVKFKSNEALDSVLQGFTLTNGKAMYGGGIYCSNASPSILDNIIVLNESWNGGGIYCTSASPEIKGNTISDNTVTLDGGGVYCWQSDAVLEKNTISYNNAAGYGGGIECVSSTMFIQENLISNNYGTNGGGIECYYASPVIRGNRVIENSAELGGGIYCFYASPEISSTNIAKNNATYGGGLYCAYSFSTFVNNTFYGNAAVEKGGGLYCVHRYAPVVTNTILWDNSAIEGPEVWLGTPSAPSSFSISYSDIKGGQTSIHQAPSAPLVWGNGMLSADPMFVDSNNNDFHLLSGSPCLETGDNDAPSLPPIDFDGDPRVLDGDQMGLAIVDMGSDELNPVLNVPGDYSTIQEAIDNAVDGHLVLVAPGTYQENIDFKGKAITVRSSQGPLVTTIDGSNPMNPDFGSVVIFQSGEGPLSIIDGFILTNGKGTLNVNVEGTPPDLYGGGVYCDDSSPTIRNNYIQYNSAGTLTNFTYGSGGGIFCWNKAAPVIENNNINHNFASNGGGVCCLRSGAYIMDNEISFNHANYGGGGIYCGLTNRKLVIRDNTLSSNDVNLIYESGVIYLYGLAEEDIISANTISNNITRYGLFLRAINNVIISENHISDALEYGIMLRGSSENIVDRNRVENNHTGILMAHDFISGNNSIKNRVYHNDFISSNTVHAIDNGIDNIWDNGYPSGGNYWDDYTGVDGNGDGIGDTPYVINSSSQDNYPLINSYNHLMSRSSLEADKHNLVYDVGGSVTLTLSAGEYNAFRDYVTFCSLSGVAPGVILPGGLAVLPLNWDSFTDFGLKLINTPVFFNFMGTLDFEGKAQAQFNTHGPVPPTLCGATFYFAYALTAPLNFASNWVSVTISSQ